MREFSAFHSDSFAFLANRIKTMALGHRGPQMKLHIDSDSGKFERNVYKVSSAESRFVGVAGIFFTPTLRSIPSLPDKFVLSCFSI